MYAFVPKSIIVTQLCTCMQRKSMIKVLIWSV